MQPNARFYPGRKLCVAFTLCELLVVTATISLWCIVGGTALARVRPQTSVAQCLANHRQLLAAWHLYAEDNHGDVVGNTYGSDGPSNKPWLWSRGWLDWTPSADNTNTAFTANEKYSGLARYVNHDPRIYQCPADTFVSGVQAARGFARRARSYSMNGPVGDWSSQPAPWSSVYARIRRLSDFQRPAPSEAFVFIEEHPDSINDSVFFPPDTRSWIDMPGALHDAACVLGFADGHAEARSWAGSAASPRSLRVRYIDYGSIVALAGDPDLGWIASRTPRVR